MLHNPLRTRTKAENGPSPDFSLHSNIVTKGSLPRNPPNLPLEVEDEQ